MPPHLRFSLGDASRYREPDRSRASTLASTIASVLAPQLGTAPLGAKLPTTRSLALQLGISPTTVATAYQLLADAALIARDGQGFAVAAPRRNPSPPLELPLEAPPSPELVPVLPANRPARGTPGYLTLSSAFLDPRLAPRDELARCMRSALRAPGLATYADAQGYLPLRQLISQRLRRAGIAALPEHILLTVGSQHVIDLLCSSLVTPRVATEDPSYLAARALFQRRGLAVTPLPITPFAPLGSSGRAPLGSLGSLDPARWRQRLTADRPALAYLTSSYQNPTGTSYSTRELHQILGWSRELGFGILEDDWAEGMLPHGERKPTLRALGGPSVLYMNAFTKKTLPSLRVGFVAGDERTIPSLLQAKKLSVNGSPALLEEALCQLIADGHYDAYLERAQREVALRYRHCLAALRALMPASVRWTLPGGGPLLWLELPRHLALDELFVELAERKVLINSQRAAFADEQRPHLHGFSLGYAFPDRDEMTLGLEILADCLRRRGA